MITYANVETTPAALARYRELFLACFPAGAADRFTADYLDWLYRANPDGRVVGFDAWDGDTLAAHYVCLPAQARFEGQLIRVLLSLNTATHPNYQGQGLFSQLAHMCYDAATALGYDAVYGVANANSTPGFIRKLGFQLVRPLEARIGLGPLLRRPSTRTPSFERYWSAAALAWRCANPNNPVRRHASGQGWQFFAPSLSPLLPAIAQLDHAAELPQIARVAWPSPARLFIGLVPDAERAYWNYASIPQRLRPSPLNLIFKPLSARVSRLDPARIRFSFLDFDAY
ncbi:GNAT family N-acetyltransferase [Pseudoduganella danionis]|uniref:GNAT family N-acetyltransferase n=1 Tax=Pseudoduganella danionis TaxID=1890295 RepID=A0ABW9SI82_9BURK|nr:GNAT family N-acetyltransferase [Pseudoduganella danionis]